MKAVHKKIGCRLSTSFSAHNWKRQRVNATRRQMGGMNGKPENDIQRIYPLNVHI